MPFRPLLARDPHEAHRASTPLELLFDLVTVIAVAAVTGGLHHAIAEGHGLAMLPNFVFLFLAIWWAWVNFTWLASAFGREDTLYRLLVLVLLGGALLFAGGVPSIFETLSFRYGLLGWTVMRVATVGLWLRAARGGPRYRRTALVYAVGISIAQVCWALLSFLVAPSTGWFYVFGMACFLVEWTVPVVAERHVRTPWHHHHIAERYGLLTIIVLGELLLSVARAFGRMYEAGTPTAAFATSAVSGLVVVFVLFWLYFADEAPRRTNAQGEVPLRHVFAWGYGHVFFYGAVAALGAGLAAETDVALHAAHLAAADVAWYVAAPLALAFAALWFVRDRFLGGLGVRGFALPAMAVAALALGEAGAPVWAFALLATAALVWRVPLFGGATA